MDNENNKEFENNVSNTDDIETISFDNLIDDPIISNNQGSLSSFFNGVQNVQQDENLEISNTENTEEEVNTVIDGENSETIEQQKEQTLNTDLNDFQESYKTDSASSIIDDINSANLQPSSKKSSKHKDDQPSGIGFIVILFIILIIFIFALPYITKLF
ncbi:MAG: hypothetical protein NC181_02975 [Clostridium sp.]|nr:hypothetical protein [Clostridium sp.]MCM1444200.1 hypothetical protein [Candidatus Amulumruptor caecigallinarius]